MLHSRFWHSGRSVRIYPFRVILALLCVAWMPVSTAMAGKSIFDNDQPADSTEKPREASKPAPLPAQTPAPPPAEAIPPAPATSPAPTPSASDAPAESALAVPSPADISRSAKLIKELFVSEFADHTPAGRRALAATLLKDVDKNSDDASAQYVLLSQARDLAASAGDVGLAAEADSELTERFRLSPTGAMKTRLTALSSAIAVRNRSAAWSADEAAEAIGALNDSADASVRLGDLASADKFVELARTVAQSSRDPTLIETARARSARQQAVRSEFDAFAAAQAILSSNPADPSSNLAAGRYLCDVKLDWQRGLPLLTRASDASLKQIAEEEMAPPSDPAAQETLGTAWWEVADRSPPAEQDWLRRRALYWYQHSLSGLDGLAKARAESRLSQYQDLIDAEPAVPMSGVKIIKAVYGAGDQSADWTDSVQKALEQDPFIPIVATNSVAGDPAQGVGKSMKISYVWRGKNADTEIAEDEGGVVPSFPDSGLAVRGASRKFKIVAVRWGWGTQSRDITASIKPLLLDPTQPFTPPGETLEPDPAFGTHKWLAIWFDNHGRRFVRLCRDDRFPITLLTSN